MLGSVKKWKRERKLKERLLTHTRSKRFCSIQSAKTVGILYSYEGKHTNHLIGSLTQELAQYNIKCDALGYFNNKTLPPEYAPIGSNHMICEADLDWSGSPVSEDVEKFIAQEFDILIDLARKNDFVYKFIASLSKASFKIGGVNYEDNPYDFVLLENTHDDKKFIDQIFQFLLTVKSA